MEEDELPEQMGVAQAVQAGVAEVGFQAVVDGAAEEVGQDAEGIHGLVAALDVDAEPGQKSGRGVMEPVQFAGHAHAGFVEVGQGGLAEQGMDLRFKGGQGLVEFCFDAQESRLTDGLAEKVLAHLRDALQGQELLVPPVAQPGLEARAILGRGMDALGEGSDDLSTRAGTEFDLRLVLGDAQANLGEIEDLAALLAHQRLPAQILATAAGTQR